MTVETATLDGRPSPEEASKVEVDTKQLVESMQIEVVLKGTKQWLPRLRLGVLLMRFACFVGGFGGAEIVPAGPKGRYFTDYKGADGGVFAGPDIKADSWEEAEALVAQLEANYPGIRVVDGTRRDEEIWRTSGDKGKYWGPVDEVKHDDEG